MIIEEKIIRILSQNIKDNTGEPIAVRMMEEPSDIDRQHLLVQKVASEIRSRSVKSANIVVQSYAESLYTAAVLNEKVKDLLLNFDDDEIISINLITDHNYTLPSVKQYRYQALFLVKHY